MTMRLLPVAILLWVLSAQLVNAEDAMAILQDNCSKCHGAAKQSGKLDSRTLESLLVGGKRGPAIVPGNAAESRLVQLLRPGAKPHMPPGKKQLRDEQIQTVASWIDQLRLDPVPPQLESLPADPGLPPRIADPTTVIDFLIQSGYAEHGLTPNGLTSDAEFARRLYLDLIARIPTPVEMQQFVSATDSQKRTALIDELLATDEYAQRMAQAFDVMLMGRSERRTSDRRRHGWHAYLQQIFRENRPWDEVASEVLLARADSTNRGHIWFLHERNNNHQAMAEAISRSFFGIDIACAQCHDHPLAEEIKQAHYWGLVAFFNRSKNANAKHGIALSESAIGGFNEFANALAGTTEQATLLFLDREPVSETLPENPDKQKDSDELYIEVENEPRIPRFSRRQKFVDEILAGHPLLARSMVNRMWALLMGRGIVHPVDKMDSEHPASHPQLLDWLTRDFQEHGYDVRRLVASIARSRTYQLQSGIPARAQEKDFACGLEKPLSAEALIRSMAVALSLEVPDETVGRTLRKLFPDLLVENKLTSLQQTMMLSNHAELQQLFLDAAEQIESGDSIVDQVQQLYARVFHRRPSDDELFAVSDYLRARSDRRGEALAEVLWAMLCSAEFRFNH